MNQASSSRFPTELADRCVKCGLCLPHCPTYALARNEGDSPRGRISLMQGLATGELEVSPALLGHLDRCLVCRTCERVCPAEVPFGQLIDAARGGLAERGQLGARSARLSAWVLGRRPVSRFLARCLQLARQTGLLWLAARIGPTSVRRLVARVPKSTRPWKSGSVPASASQKDAVMLFTGCLAPLIDAETLDDACRVLSAMGFEVACDSRQTCCGALHLHSGAPKEAAALALQNQAALAGSSAPVIGLASACTATLSEYGLLLDGDRTLADRVHDIIAWIADHADRLPALALPQALACVVHAPCTLRNVLQGHERLGPILARIRHLDWRPLDPPHSCCGAAGSYMLSQPALSDTLAAEQLAGLQANPPDFLLSSNIGCALHLQAAAAELRLDLRVIHPISLIAMALPANADKPEGGGV